MEPLSPPKRMTRARAAAKATGEASVSAPAKPANSRAKAAAASSKAKSTTARSASTATATTASAAAKRKLRPEDIETDDDDDDDELGLDHPGPAMQKIVRAVRGRPRKTPTTDTDVESEATTTTAPTRASKARSAASKAVDPTRPASRASTVSSSATSLATRTKKISTAGTGAVGEPSEEPAKKRATRTRATSASAGPSASLSASTATRISVRSASATIASRAVPAPRKKVTFEEPEKENIAPTTKGKASAKSATTPAAAKRAADEAASSTGLKAKPARRTATTGAEAAAATVAKPRNASATAAPRSRIASAKPTSSKPAGAPLSPKKVTQMRLTRDFEVESEDELGAPDESHLKPFERSPTKPTLSGGLTPAKRNKKLTNAGLDLDQSTRDINARTTLLPPSEIPGGLLTSPARRPPQSPSKDGLMTSPARRLDGLAPLDAVMASSAKSGSSGAAGNNNANASVLFSPAKRFPVQDMGFRSASGALGDTFRSPMKMSLLKSPAKRPASPAKAAIVLQRLDMKDLSTGVKANTPAPSEVTEEADVPDDDEANDVNKDNDTESLTKMLSDMASEAALAVPDSPSRRTRLPRRQSLRRRSTAVSVEADLVCDPMDIDESSIELVVETSVTAALPTAQSPAVSHQKPPTGLFGLRAKDLAFDGQDSDTDESDYDVTTHFPAPTNDNTPATLSPVKARRSSKTPSSTVRRTKAGAFGFTPLAAQLNSWKAHSPSKEKATNDAVEVSALTPKTADDDGAPSAGVSEPATAVASLLDGAMAGHSQPTSPCHIEDTEQQVSTNSDLPDLLDNAFQQDTVQTPEFDDDLAVTQEDLDLAQEANDMSLMEPVEIDDIVSLPREADDAISEASQEYGDENAIPIDPILLTQSGLSPAVPPVTPARVITRTFHTVSKVPLKPADDSTPPPRRTLRRRSLSTSRLSAASRRHSGVGIGFDSKKTDSGLSRSATVISYSPSKKDGRSSRRKSRRESFGGPDAADMEMTWGSGDNGKDDSNDEGLIHDPFTSTSIPVTPTKSDAGWSTAGTPARTPRRDLNPGLLRGVVVFVDVHTTEGADASAIFVDLLSQMGARCVKSWSWNPFSPPGNKDSSSKVGITHVVFKDGSKRTLEKVRESNGVVQCVGVSWVLDCERENAWVEESPYYIDTALVPRGGARRRKSMEPQALANLNGLLVSTPAKQTGTSSSFARECRSAPSTPMNRRDSTLWVRTPEDEKTSRGYDEDGAEGRADGEEDVDADGDPDWGMTALLTPVPKTPAPEAIAQYAANIIPSTPYGSDAGGGYYDDEDTVSSMQFGQGDLVMRTCPPKPRAASYAELGTGILSREKDEGVLMRLMAARRKSLQFAPKVASPLSKAWNN